MRCAVVTKIADGFEESIFDTLASVDKALEFGFGSFSIIELMFFKEEKSKLKTNLSFFNAIQKASKRNFDWVFFLEGNQLLFKEAFKVAQNHLRNLDALWGENAVWDKSSIQMGEQNPKTFQSEKGYKKSRGYKALNDNPFIKLKSLIDISVHLAPQDQNWKNYSDLLWSSCNCKKIESPFVADRLDLF
tara:strand:+ start:338 stop:904 length:567 start_codon:yes stop_codon:yes gene_type:complete